MTDRYCPRCGAPLVEFVPNQWASEKARCACPEYVGPPGFCEECGARLIPTTTGRCCPHGHGRIQLGPPSVEVQGADLRRAGDVVSKWNKRERLEAGR